MSRLSWGQRLASGLIVLNLAIAGAYITQRDWRHAFYWVAVALCNLGAMML